MQILRCSYDECSFHESLRHVVADEKCLHDTISLFLESGTCMPFEKISVVDGGFDACYDIVQDILYFSMKLLGDRLLISQHDSSCREKFKIKMKKKWRLAQRRSPRTTVSLDINNKNISLDIWIPLGTPH